MDHPVRVAWCNILFAANGGQFNKRGLPILGQDEVRGYCDRAFDCASCEFMAGYIAARTSEGWNYGWVCSDCLKGTREKVEANCLVITGHFQSGRDPNLQPEDEDYDPDLPVIAGCTNCGWQTSFLQLVLWR